MKFLKALWIIVGIALVAALAVFFIQQFFCVYTTYASNVGEEVDVSTLMRYNVKGAKFASDSEDFDINTPGTYDVKVDAGIFEHSCKLTIEDKTPPEFVVMDDFTAPLGDNIKYRDHVVVKDNSGFYDLSVDASSVDPNTEGTYNIVYTATDPSGNSSLAVVWVTLTQPIAPEESELYNRVDQILSGIITEDMTPREKAKAIHSYVYENLHYVLYENHEDWVLAANDGLDSYEGDCYVFFAVAKAMLNRAGVKNADVIHREYPNFFHAWSAVDVEDGHGWYYFDSLPRDDGNVIFLWTDAQIKALNDRRYIYDPEIYPKIP